MSYTPTTVFDNGPYELLQKIAWAFSIESGPDFRATVTIHTASSKSWTGIPIQASNNRNGEFIVLGFKDKKTSVVLPLAQVTAVEVEDPSRLDSFFTKPWLSDSRYTSVSKLQATRDLDASWKDEPRCKVAFDTFPATDEAPGFVLAWTALLKSELEKIRTEFGADALAKIHAINVTYGSGAMTCSKVDSSLNFTISISVESMDRKAIAAKLNESL